MSGRAAQDEDAVRRIKLEADIATRRRVHQDRHRASKGPDNIEFLPQTIMRVREIGAVWLKKLLPVCSLTLSIMQTDALFKNSGDRIALHPVLHVYVHCILYENENPAASSKVSSFINVTYDRQCSTSPVLERSNFVDVMEVQ